ncbi:twin-arginine translocation signal domain-containing protein [Fimbriimonas ginsengisoli]|uniref:Alpha-galactosidase n=1 Tax=Fimbriimonas ginsengisoli Gsoil 348 TaxID=661478 RepID=A0A068NRS8_FIMGI|nr:twin-arginine translocation signal domain-containing protein [Fimbriimonas ginsengisoli]AIE84324.1 hypothetical protein OP10G_0956 [Fimbriimonas ginsengisoli Gsoil 348]
MENDQLKQAGASRRDLLKGAALAGLVGGPTRVLSHAVEAAPSFVTLLRPPDLVRTFGVDNHEIKIEKTREGVWEGNGVEVEIAVHGNHVRLSLRSKDNVCRIHVRWHGDMRSVKRYLGDHWERSYGDLEWRGEVPGRTMPWYFMAFDGHRTHGYGVRTGPAAMCFWNADAQGVSLWADVRSGGAPVELGPHTLEVAEIVCREGRSGESPFAATQAFCRQMCLHPRLPEKPVYGTNDWNYAYGNNSAELIAGVSGLISELSPDKDNRPYSVIDEGWAEGPFQGNFGHGPWVGNPRFGDMATFAARLKGLGVRPGIWFRPLTPLPDTPQSWRSARNSRYLDPTIPEVREHVASHIRRLVGWGYEMVKHDFTTWDLLGMWGFEMGASPTRDGWHLHDRSKTNAEAFTDLYRTIREAAGDARLIGCNTVSHLATGFHEVQRTGDDTSGRSWNRNRRMGVNTLAFRAAQHRAFYEVDPDIVAITKAVPWRLVEQWLRLVSESGTALFVAVEPEIVEPHHRVALKKAFEFAAKPQVIGEPLDWMETDCPRRWRLRGKETEFAWMGDDGAWPFGD